jgi:hypothetical protein
MCTFLLFFLNKIKFFISKEVKGTVKGPASSIISLSSLILRKKNNKRKTITKNIAFWVFIQDFGYGFNVTPLKIK